MLGIKYVMSKTAQAAASIRSTAPSSPLNTNDVSRGEELESESESAISSDIAAHEKEQLMEPSKSAACLRKHALRLKRYHENHTTLIESGKELGRILHETRERLQERQQSEMYLMRSTTELAVIQNGLKDLRSQMERIAKGAMLLEKALIQRTEESMAKQNAAFAAKKQEELEKFEQMILNEKEESKRRLLEERRNMLEKAFRNDLETYQKTVGARNFSGNKLATSEDKNDSLDDIELTLDVNAKELEDFYRSSENGSEENV